MKLRRLNDAIFLPLIAALLSMVTIAIVLFRMFAITFFWASVSKWALVPALVTVFMIFIARLAQTPRRYIAIVLAGFYLCSIYFDGWSTIAARVAEGGSAWFEATEAALIGIFLVLHLIPDVRLSDHAN